MKRSIVVLLVGVACNGGDASSDAMTLSSIPALDGSVDRAGVVDSTSTEMEVGRNGNGIGVRGFVAFDIASLLPEEGEEAVVSSATLSVYENNFNLLPWDTMGNVLVEGVAYDKLAADAFAAPAIGEAVVASSDSNFLDFHSIGVDAAVTAALNADAPSGLAQFRFRYDDDTDTDDQTLQDHHWDLNTAEATDPPDSGPTLTLTVEYVTAETP